MPDEHKQQYSYKQLSGVISSDTAAKVNVASKQHMTATRWSPKVSHNELLAVYAKWIAFTGVIPANVNINNLYLGQAQWMVPLNKYNKSSIIYLALYICAKLCALVELMIC